MSVRRILIVIGALAVVGAVLGAGLGGLLGFAAGVVLGGLAVEGAVIPLLRGSLLGAALGGALAPVAGWFLLRHVPVGRAMGLSAIGTAAGAGIGLFLIREPWTWLWLALAGFAVTALWLRLTTRPPAADAAPDSDVPAR